MTTNTDICNRALQILGTRTDVTDAELAGSTTNEAKQFNLIFANMRDDLLRLAPWDSAYTTANLTYITSAPGTPENTSAATTLWAPGQPPPGWAYEYQYPVDCLRAIQIIPANQTGFAGSVPITTAVTGGAAAFWWGAPVKFKVQSDNFYTVSAAAVNAAGTGYVVGDLIILQNIPATTAITNKIGTFNIGCPQGAPVVLQVATIGGGGAVATVNVVSQLPGEANFGGSYFYSYPSISNTAVAQGSTTGAGTGATFNLTFTTVPSPQRVIVANQEFATLQYIKQITDPAVMDTLFQTAWIRLCAAAMAMALRGDKTFANMLIGMVNDAIIRARSIDGNEGLTINDVTPDFVRIRGVAYAEGYVSGPYTGYDFGGVWPMFI